MAAPRHPGPPAARSSASWGRESSPPRPRLVGLTTWMPCSPPMARGTTWHVPRCHLAAHSLPQDSPKASSGWGFCQSELSLPEAPCHLGVPLLPPAEHTPLCCQLHAAAAADVHPVIDRTWKRSPKLKALRQSTNEPHTRPYVARIFSNAQLAPGAGDTPMTAGLRQASPPAQARGCPLCSTARSRN